MTSTVFVDLVGPPVNAAWLNDANAAVYTTLPLLLSAAGSSSVGYTPAGTGAIATTVQRKLGESVSVKDFGADPTGVSDSTAAIQVAINTGLSLIFPPGVYSVSSLYYWWGDTGTQATRIYYGPGAVIKGNASVTTQFLFQIAGQNLRIVGLEVQGKGSLDTTYTGLWQFDTRSNAVALNNIYLEDVVSRFNNKAVIYGLATDTTAKVSEIFFRNCTFIQCQKIFDIQAPGLCDLVATGSYFAQSALAASNANENYIVKAPNGNVIFDNCHLMATGLNGNVSVGWVGYFPDNSSSTLTITGGVLEAKEGFNWGSGSSSKLKMSTISNGYWGWQYNGEAFFSVGSNVTGGAYLSNVALINSYGHGPYLIDASTSPLFQIRTDDACRFTSVSAPVVNIFTKIIGGQWNFPETEVALLYGRTSNPVTSPNIDSVKYATDWISSSNTVHRFKGNQAAGVVTIPTEGLKNAWLEVLVDWDQATSLCYVTRHTSVNATLNNGLTYVQVNTAQNAGGNLFERGVAPGGRVYDSVGTYVNTISATSFANGSFNLSGVYAGSTSTQNISVQMEIAPVSKGVLQRIYLGDLWPSDAIRLTLKAVSATTDTTLSYQKMRLVGGSRITSLGLNGGV